MNSLVNHFSTKQIKPDYPTCRGDRKSTRLNSSHSSISYAVFCLKKKRNKVLDYEDRLPVPDDVNRRPCLGGARAEVSHALPIAGDEHVLEKHHDVHMRLELSHFV